MFLHAALQLRSYYLLERSPNTSLKEGILKAYRAALSLISKCQQAEMESRLLTCGPSLFEKALCVACTFSLKVLRSGYSKLVDEMEGRKTFNLGLSLMRRCSIEDNDLPGRFSKIFAQLWNASSGTSSGNGELKVRTRLGGSLLHDTLWKWRECFGGQASRSITPSASGRENTPSLATGEIMNTDKSAQPQGLTQNPTGGSCQNGLHGLHPNGTAGRSGPSFHLGHEEQSLPGISAGWPGRVSGVDLDLVDEINNEWLWNGGGLSSLLAMDLDTMDLPMGELGSENNGDMVSSS